MERMKQQTPKFSLTSTSLFLLVISVISHDASALDRPIHKERSHRLKEAMVDMELSGNTNNDPYIIFNSREFEQYKNLTILNNPLDRKRIETSYKVLVQLRKSIGLPPDATVVSVHDKKTNCFDHCNKLYGACEPVSITMKYFEVCECLFDSIQGPWCGTPKSGFDVPLHPREIQITVNTERDYWKVLRMTKGVTNRAAIYRAYQKEGARQQDPREFSLIVEAYWNLRYRLNEYQILLAKDTESLGEHKKEVNASKSQMDIELAASGIGCVIHSDCFNGGQCVRQGPEATEAKRCLCPAEYSPPYCKERFNCFLFEQLPGNKLRRKNKCLQGGKCVEYTASGGVKLSKCLCPLAKTGNLCETDFTAPYDLCREGEWTDGTLQGTRLCECEAGWMGNFCDEQCSQHYWGTACINNCLGVRFCKNSVPCNHVTGTCPRGCDPGWKPSTTCDIPNAVYVAVEMILLPQLQINRDLQYDSMEYHSESDKLTKFVLQHILQDHITNRRTRETPQQFLDDAEDITNMDYANVIKTARQAGFGLNNMQLFSADQSSVTAAFDVTLAQEYSDEIQLRQLVTHAIVRNLDGYNSTLTGHYKIDKGSVSVSQVKPVSTPFENSPSPKNESRKLPFILPGILVGLFTLLLLLVVICATFTMSKKRRALPVRKTFTSVHGKSSRVL